MASTSPRRKSLLKSEGIDFKVVSPNYDEEFGSLDFTYEKIKNVSLQKALSIKDMVDENSVIISADTVVVFENLAEFRNKADAEIGKDIIRRIRNKRGNGTAEDLLLRHNVPFVTAVAPPAYAETCNEVAQSVFVFKNIEDRFGNRRGLRLKQDPLFALEAHRHVSGDAACAGNDGKNRVQKRHRNIDVSLVVQFHKGNEKKENELRTRIARILLHKADLDSVVRVGGLQREHIASRYRIDR